MNSCRTPVARDCCTTFGETGLPGLVLAVVASLVLATGATAVAVSTRDKDGFESKAARAAELASWPDEKKAAWNADIDAKVAELARKGIVVETTEIAPGVRDIVWTEELKTALKGSDYGKNQGK